MRINGEMLIGAQAVLGTAGTTRAINPATRQEIDPPFGLGLRADVDRAAALAQAAFDPFRATSPEDRARFLEAVAQNILDLGDALIERAQAESGLPAARLTGERGRTVGQLRLFARAVRDGLYQTPVIDPAQPERTPLPRADLRLRKIALGPVAVFGASNFPLAFSVAGGDTASALAAGCPVIVKAHSAHLGTSELVGRAIQKAVKDAGLPEGVFSLLIGAGREIGEALVAHPVIKAVGFTGSRQGGSGTGQDGQRPSRTHSRLCRDEQHQPGVPAAPRIGQPCGQTGIGFRRFADHGVRTVLHQSGSGHRPQRCDVGRVRDIRDGSLGQEGGVHHADAGHLSSL